MKLMHSSRTKRRLIWRTSQARPDLAVMLGVVLVFCLVIISAELTAAQYVDSEGRERKTLNRNKDVVYDKEKELSSRTTMEIDMYVRDEKHYQETYERARSNRGN